MKKGAVVCVLQICEMGRDETRLELEMADGP